MILCPLIRPLLAAGLACLLSASDVLSQEKTSPTDPVTKLIAELKFQEAEVYLTQSVARLPADAETFHRLGLVRLMQGDSEQAVLALEKSVALAPARARYHFDLGDAYGQACARASMFSALSIAKRCIASFEQAVRLEPDNLLYRKSCYDFYSASPAAAGGGEEKTRTMLAEIEARDPVQGAGLRADFAVKRKDISEAHRRIDDLKSRFTPNKVALYFIGQIAALSGQRLDEGEVALRKYLEHQPTEFEPQLWAAHWQLGQIAEKKKDRKTARQEYQATLLLNPTFGLAQTALKKL